MDKERNTNKLNLAFEREEKIKRAEEILIANIELTFQSEEKHRQAAELLITNKELLFQIVQSAQRSDELIIANKELTFQYSEKEKRNNELILARKELVFRNSEKLKTAALTTLKSELSKSEKQFQLMVANIKDYAIFMLDINGRIASWNSGAHHIKGYTEQEIIGKPMSVFYTPEEIYLGMPKRNLQLALQCGNIETEGLLLKKDGSTFYANIVITAIFDEHGVLQGFSNITKDITKIKKAEIQIIKTTAELRQLTDHLQTIREEERQRIAREIHDELGQQLTAIKMDTVWIDKQIPVETVAVKNKLQNMLELLDGSHQSVRKILNELRPAFLDDNGLLEALQWQGRQFTERTGIPVHFKTNLESSNLSNETATCIFRVYQESLTNIMRYAQATVVVSSLKSSKESIILAVEDDGNGFDTLQSETKKRFGLLGMKERVNSLNGNFDLISSPGKGTKIVVRLPYKNI